jgi:hypothetical protein
MLPSAFSGCGRARSPAWSSRTASAQFPTPPEPGTTVPAAGLNIGKLLQFSVFVIIEVVGAHAIKRARLNKREHYASGVCVSMSIGIRIRGTHCAVPARGRSPW